MSLCFYLFSSLSFVILSEKSNGIVKGIKIAQWSIIKVCVLNLSIGLQLFRRNLVRILFPHILTSFKVMRKYHNTNQDRLLLDAVHLRVDDCTLFGFVDRFWVFVKRSPCLNQVSSRSLHKFPWNCTKVRISGCPLSFGTFSSQVCTDGSWLLGECHNLCLKLWIVELWNHKWSNLVQQSSNSLIVTNSLGYNELRYDHCECVQRTDLLRCKRICQWLRCI